jgi:hypothetical protein
MIRHRHSAYLGNGNRMIIELSGHDDYQALADLERVLKDVYASMSFVKDTIASCMQCNYRIDYALSLDRVRTYRIRRYEPKGSFLYQRYADSALRPFKPEADTVHLLLPGALFALPGVEKLGLSPMYGKAQVTLILNRYSNIEGLIQEGKINAIVDTLRVATQPKRKFQRKHFYSYETSAYYTQDWRDTSRARVFVEQGLHSDDALGSHASAIDAQLNFGAGFLRDRLAPEAEIGLVYRFRSTRLSESRFILGLYGSCYTGFVKDAEGKYEVQPNFFINAEYGTEDEQDALWQLKTSRIAVGLGYLISAKGDYFSGATMKAFMNIRLRNGFTLSPEIIATDNLKQVFPGLTLKVF